MSTGKPADDYAALPGLVGCATPPSTASRRLTRTRRTRPRDWARDRVPCCRRRWRLRLGREAEIHSAVRRVEPAARDDLAAGKEVDALGAVRVGVAEQRRLPAAERVVGHRH